MKVKVNSIDKSSTSSKFRFQQWKLEFKKRNDENKYIKQIRDMINNETEDNSSDSILKEVTDYIEKQQIKKKLNHKKNLPNPTKVT